MGIVEALQNKIINAPFREITKDIPDKSIDLLLTDPPYGIEIVKQLVKKDPYNKHGYKSWDLKEWDNKKPTKEDFDEMFRISKNQVICGANYFASMLADSQGWLVWNKGQRNFSLADGELIYTSFDKAIRIFDYSRASALKDIKIHPTQKPVALFKWILGKYTKEGDTVIDCYSGSGTTAVACHEMKRNFICIERDADYYSASVERLKNKQAQTRLF